MVGFIIVDLPGIVVLTVATLFFSTVPVIGATLIWVGAAAWLQDSGQTGSAIFLLLWEMFGISSVDNFVNPILTSSLPLLLIVGVFGGVLVFGFIELFLGPTLLALGQLLIKEWLDHVVYGGHPSI